MLTIHKYIYIDTLCTALRRAQCPQKNNEIIIHKSLLKQTLGYSTNIQSSYISISHSQQKRGCIFALLASGCLDNRPRRIPCLRAIDANKVMSFCYGTNWSYQQLFEFDC